MIVKKELVELYHQLFFFFTRIKMFRIHNVEEVKQGLLVFETLLKNEKKIFWYRWNKRNSQHWKH